MQYCCPPRPLIDAETNTYFEKTLVPSPYGPFGVTLKEDKVTKVTAKGYGSERDVVTALFGWLTHTGKLKGDEKDELRVTDVLFNGPATIALWTDDTKTITKCHKGDKFNGTFGILACAIRKLTRNRGKEVDHFEGVISDLAKYTLMPDDWRKLSDAIGMLADALEVEGVARNAAKHEREYVEPKEPVDADRLVDKISEQASDNEAVQEQVRQTIRDLLDRGEL